MKILLIDNGSPSLETLRAALKRHTIDVLGYPFLPGLLAARVRGADRVVFSGSTAPRGVDLAYAREIIEAVGAVKVPTLGIALGAAVLIESRGGKAKRTADGFIIKKAPPGWREEAGCWRDTAGNVACIAEGDWRRALDLFFGITT